LTASTPSLSRRPRDTNASLFGGFAGVRQSLQIQGRVLIEILQAGFAAEFDLPP